MTYRTGDSDRVLFRGHIFCFGLPRLVLQRSQPHPFKLPGYLYVVAVRKGAGHLSKRSSAVRLDIYPTALSSCCHSHDEGGIVSMADFTAMNKYFNQYQKRNFRVVLDRIEDCCEFAFSTLEELQRWEEVLRQCVISEGSSLSRFRLSWRWGKRPDAPPRTQASLALPMYYYIDPEPCGYIPLPPVAIKPLTHEYLQLYDEGVSPDVSSSSDSSLCSIAIDSTSLDTREHVLPADHLPPVRKTISLTVYRSLQEQARADVAQNRSRANRSAWRKAASSSSSKRKDKSSALRQPNNAFQFQAEATWQPQAVDRYSYPVGNFEKLIALNRERNGIARIEEYTQVYSEHHPMENS